MICIGVKNESTVVSDIEVQDAIVAMQIQHDADFSKFWKTEVSIAFYKKDFPLPSGVWGLVVLDDSDQAGALGYHDLTKAGEPLAKVFAKDDIANGANWTVTMSHELHEMLVDPYINLVVQVNSGFYAYETDDAVEDDDYAQPIKIPSGKTILISDSVTPNWFIPNSLGPWDVYNHCEKPLQLLDNGYIGYFLNGNWSQITARLTNVKGQKKATISAGHRRYMRSCRAEGKFRTSDK